MEQSPYEKLTVTRLVKKFQHSGPKTPSIYILTFLHFE